MSSSWNGTALRLQSTVVGAVPETVTFLVWDPYPRAKIRKVCAPGVTPRMVYCPCWLVTPYTCWVMPWTRAPATGCPLAPSVTFPVTLPCWAAAVPPIAPSASQTTALTLAATGIRMDPPG